jgi:hypothetical protein
LTARPGSTIKEAVHARLPAIVLGVSATSVAAAAGASQLLDDAETVLVEWLASVKTASVPAEAAPPVREAGAAMPLPCSPEMVLIEGLEGEYCVDRFEASLVELASPHKPWPGNQRVFGRLDELSAVSRAGVKPQGYINGFQAEAMCGNAGKRLCTSSEWTLACQGPREKVYPYGNVRKANACNDRYRVFTNHPVVRLFQREAPRGTPQAQMWLPRWMSDPRLHEFSDTVTLTGEKSECEGDSGTFDMVGNLHEWVSDQEGTFRGGFFMDTYQNGEGCKYVTKAHTRRYYDYSTGFRCCADAASSL